MTRIRFLLGLLFLIGCDQKLDKYYYSIEENEEGNPVLDSFKIRSLEEGMVVGNNKIEFLFTRKEKGIFYEKKGNIYLRFENNEKIAIVSNNGRIKKLFTRDKKDSLNKIISNFYSTWRYHSPPGLP
jgi:hypothetical protein